MPNDYFIEKFNKVYGMKMFGAVLPALLFPMAGAMITDAPLIWPLSTLLYNVGLLCCFALVPPKAVKIIGYIIFAALFFCTEAAFFLSYYLQNAGFNAAFFYHVRPDLLYAGVNEQLPLLLLALVCLLGFLAVSSYNLAGIRLHKGWTAYLAPVLLTIGLFISPPVKALVMYDGNNSPDNNKNNAFAENFKELPTTEINIKFTKQEKPNIVLIYAESLEQRFFDETIFPDLVPGLQKLKEQSIDFINISQGAGSGWTIGGIVASQCGYPLAGSKGVNDNDFSVFDKFLPKATCLGDLLAKDGYHLTFIGGADARFAGKGAFLRSHGYSEILDRVQLQKYNPEKSYVTPWGLFDDTLLDYSFKKFISLSREKSPFMLALLTLDPHGTKGHMSRSCNPYLSGDNSSLNSFHCSDQLITKFIKKIRSSPYSKNTFIFVLSDHLSMRNKATPLLESSNSPRRLTFLANTPGSQHAQNANPGLHYDITPTILDLVGYHVKGQIGFGAPLSQGPGYLPGKFGAEEWKKQSANLVAIAETLWDDTVTIDQAGIKYTASDVTLALGGRKFLIGSEGYTNIPASVVFIFNEKSLRLESIRFYSLDRGLTPTTLGKELLKHKEKLVLAISRAKFMPGFTSPQNDPDERVYYFGKPGSEIYSWGILLETLTFPYEIIPQLSQSKIDPWIISERESILKESARNKPGRAVRLKD